MTNNAQTSTEWQKLSPIAIIYFVLHFIVRFVKDGLINIAPAFAVFVTQVENKLFWLSIGIVALVVAIVIYAVLFYLNFRYKITEHEIILRKGVVKKERVTLNFAKVQNVNLATPFYFAPFNLVNCHFDAAGSAQQEVVLPGIALDYANVMRDEIFNYATHAEQQPEAEAAVVKKSSPQLRLSNFEVAKFGLMSSMMLLVFAALAPFMNHITAQVDDTIIMPLTAFFERSLQSNQHAEAVAIIFSVAGFITLFILASIIGALIRFYNFELSLENNKLKRVSGLFERHQMSLSINKVQSIEIKQNWIAKLLKRYTISCKQIYNSHANTVKKGQSLIVPVLTEQQVTSVSEMCWTESIEFKKIPFSAISIHYFYKTFALFCLLPCTVLALALAFHQQLFFVSWIILLALLVLGAGINYLRFKRYGFYFDGEQVYVRKGFIGTSYKVFKGFKVQQVAKIQTPFMQKQALATLRFQLASGGITIPYLSQSCVSSTMNTLIYQAETSKKHWM